MNTDTIITRLQTGDSPCDIARDTGCTTGQLAELDYDSQCALDDDLIAVILPDYSADDGNAQIDEIIADDPQEAAEQYVEGGEWGDRSETSWVHVYAWRRGYVLDPDTGEVEEISIDRDRFTETLEALEPECDADEHDWQSPIEVLGGIEQNPGVWGHGGGVVIHEVCRQCGVYRITDTWAQDPGTGEQGLRSLKYRDADDASLQWIESQNEEDD